MQCLGSQQLCSILQPFWAWKMFMKSLDFLSDIVGISMWKLKRCSGSLLARYLNKLINNAGTELRIMRNYQGNKQCPSHEIYLRVWVWRGTSDLALVYFRRIRDLKCLADRNLCKHFVPCFSYSEHENCFCKSIAVFWLCTNIHVPHTHRHPKSVLVWCWWNG